MKKSIYLSFRMESPCDQEWDNMEPLVGARYCGACQKSVVNFVGLDNKQILEFFIRSPKPVCGRIVAESENIVIKDTTPSISHRIKLNAVAATVFTFASLNTKAASEALSLRSTPYIQFSNDNSTERNADDSIIISGVVKDEEGNPIKDGEIVFDTVKYFSDKDGLFKFSLHKNSLKQSLIQFSYGNLITEVRNYHPVMGSTYYNIILRKRTESYHVTMGIMPPIFHLPDSLSSLSVTDIGKLNSKTKTFLNSLSHSMKANPGLNISLVAHFANNKSRVVKFTHLVKDYLVKETGIFPDRILIGEPEQHANKNSELQLEFLSEEK